MYLLPPRPEKDMTVTNSKASDNKNIMGNMTIVGQEDCCETHTGPEVRKAWFQHQNNPIIIYSTLCHSKPLGLSFFHETQKVNIKKKYLNFFSIELTLELELEWELGCQKLQRWQKAQ